MADRRDNNDLANFEVRVSDGQGGDYYLLPERTWLAAKLVAVRSKNTQKGQRANFVYETVKEYDGETRRAYRSVPLHKTVTEKADLYVTISEHLGRPLEVDESVKLGDLTGKVYLISLDNKEVGENTYQNVTKVKPYKGKGKTTARRRPAVEEEPLLVDDNLEETQAEPQEEEISEEELPF